MAMTRLLRNLVFRQMIRRMLSVTPGGRLANPNPERRERYGISKEVTFSNRPGTGFNLDGDIHPFEFSKCGE